MKLTATLFASIVTISAAASDDGKMIRGGVRGFNFYNAPAAQSDFEDTPNNESYVTNSNPCPACGVVSGHSLFCGELGEQNHNPACDYNICGAGYQCQECSSIFGYDGFVGNGAYQCV